MDYAILSRQYLETLPSADLIALADDLGIDVPENLNRRFIIGELLDTAAEIKRENYTDLKNDSDKIHPVSVLPETYNENQISVVLRNPVWAYVYWDIREADFQKIQKTAGFTSLVLRVSSFSNQDSVKPSDYFEISVSVSDRNQYVLLPASVKNIRIDLVAEFKGSASELLASSKKINLPHMPAELMLPLPDLRISPILELSGLRELLRTHYLNHRQSFL